MKSNRFLRITALLALATVITSACSGKTEDVRFKLCKKVTERILESMGPVDWQSQTSEIRGAGDAVIRLSFAVGGEDYEGSVVTSACFYRHNTNEESALEHADPLAAYATLPHRMTVNGKTVPDDILKKSVSAEQLEPIIEFVEQVKREVGKLSIGN